VVEPVDTFQSGEFDRFKVPPWPAPMDDLGLVETVDRFGEGVVVTVADACDSGSPYTGHPRRARIGRAGPNHRRSGWTSLAVFVHLRRRFALILWSSTSRDTETRLKVGNKTLRRCCVEAAASVSKNAPHQQLLYSSSPIIWCPPQRSDTLSQTMLAGAIVGEIFDGPVLAR